MACQLPSSFPSRERLLQVVNEQLAPPSRLQPKTPQDLETICLKCLEKTPENRYGSCAALADDLHRFRNGKPIRAKRTAMWTRAGKAMRRHPLVTALSAVILLALVFSLTLWIRFTTDLQTVNTKLAKKKSDLEVAVAKLAKEKEFAQLKRKEAEVARNDTRQNLSQMSEMLKDYVTMVHEKRILKAYILKSVRQELIQFTIDKYGKILARFTGDDTLRRDQAEGYFWLGTLAQEINDNAQAEKHLQKAINIQASVPRKQLKSLHELARLGVFFEFLGIVSERQGKFKDAQKHYRCAIGHLKKIAPLSTANDGGVYCLLAGANNQLALLLYQKMQKNAEAETLLLDGRKAAQKALCGTVYKAACFQKAALIERNLAKLYERLARKDVARSAYEKYVQYQEKAAEIQPNSIDYQNKLAVAYCFLASFCARHNEAKKGYELFSKAADLRDRLLKTDPSSVNNRIELIRIRLINGKNYRAKRQHNLAAREFRLALEQHAWLVRQVPREWKFALGFGQTLLLWGGNPASRNDPAFGAAIQKGIQILTPWTNEKKVEPIARQMLAQLRKVERYSLKK